MLSHNSWINFWGARQTERSVLSGFWLADNAGKRASVSTEVKVAYDQKALYILFQNEESQTESLKKTLIDRDAAIWSDDSNEVFISTGEGNAFQLITGAGGGKWDGRLVQNMEGDPWKADASWNGDWESVVKVETDRWYTVWGIPFSTLGEKPKENAVWRVNFARHRHKDGLRESSRWIYANSPSNTVSNFGYLNFEADSIRVERFVETLDLDPLKIARPKSEYAKVLGTRPGKFRTGDWGHEFYLQYYPKGYSQRFNQEAWASEFRAKLDGRRKDGSEGLALPGAAKVAGWPALEQAHAAYGMKFPYDLTNSGIDAMALENGAQYYHRVNYQTARARVVEFDPAKQAAMFQALDRFLEQSPDKIPLISYFFGIDEPTNSMFQAFSRQLRGDAGDILDRVDAEIRSSFGGGKFGLYDQFGPEDEASPFKRIAFVNWWNAKMQQWGREVRAGLEQRAPGVPVMLSNHNTVASMPFVDVPLLSGDTDYVAVDPYPTAVLALYGRARALYHTGFATKWIHDLSGKKGRKRSPKALSTITGRPLPPM